MSATKCDILRLSWLDPFRASDSLWQNAYDAAADDYKAAVKTAVAALVFARGDQRRVLDIRERDERLGFEATLRREPAPWAVVVFPSSYRAAARILTPAALSILAGCPLSLAFSIGDPPSPHILTALELCGLENLFILSINKILQAIDELFSNFGAGKLIALDSPRMEKIVARAREHNIDYFAETEEPRLALLDAEKFALALIELAQGSVPPPPRPGVVYDAVYRASAPLNNDARLILGSGLECFWLPPELNRDFFMKQILAIDAD